MAYYPLTLHGIDNIKVYQLKNDFIKESKITKDFNFLNIKFLTLNFQPKCQIPIFKKGQPRYHRISVSTNFSY